MLVNGDDAFPSLRAINMHGRVCSYFMLQRVGELSSISTLITKKMVSNSSRYDEENSVTKN